MAEIDIVCINCGKNIEVEDRFKKIICPYCGSNVTINEALIAMEKSENELRDRDKLTTRNVKMQNAYDALKNDDLEEAKGFLHRIINYDKNDAEALSVLLHINILEIDKKELEKLNTTSEATDPDFWEMIRNVLKEYNNLINISDNKYLSEEDISFINELTTAYKNMLIDCEYCDRINQLIDTYLSYLTRDDLTPVKAKRFQKKGEDYLKEIIGVHLCKNYGVRRDMTISYKHSNTLKHVYSKINNYSSLEEMEKVLKEKLNDYKNYLDSINVNSLL